eukprot:SAG31_NODE_4178_length_3499_cov_13.432941_3_plen_42_part_01
MHRDGEDDNPVLSMTHPEPAYSDSPILKEETPAYQVLRKHGL